MSQKRLWDKGGETNSQILDFTVGMDPVYDVQLLSWDILASAAHARMLLEQKLISSDDATSLITELATLYPQALERNIQIPVQLEDAHTTLESLLVDSCGEAGKRIHLGRSRNDQVLVAMRLWLLDVTSDLGLMLHSLAQNCLSKAESLTSLQMPGYTHFQQAMPTSVGMWYAAIAEHASELIDSSLALCHLMDRNPLGVASGFGTPLPINRERTTQLLGFKQVQRNPINTQNSRGRYETQLCRLFSDVASLIEKYSFDLIMFNMQELSFVTLPESFTTGSSIMPQKRNPDVLELLRASASRVRAFQTEIENICAKLPSHYHRDFQLTKGPSFQARDLTSECIELFASVLDEAIFNKDVLAKTKTAELYATYATFRLVGEGKSFRDAYRETAELLKEGSVDCDDLASDFSSIAKRISAEITQGKKILSEQNEEIQDVKQRLADIPSQVFNL